LKQIATVVLLVILIRLPFLNQAIQGDDFYYLKGAEHALVDPLHPNHARYIFQGVMVDMRGHPHPPLNSWILAGLLAIFGEVREIPFHLAYTLFSLIAALSVLAIARRFTTNPLLAAVLFIVTPAFVVNGNSLEADLPFVAFWLLAVAFFVYDRYVPAAVAAALAALAAYQAIVLAPVLLAWNWRSRRAWLSAAAAPATIAAYQLFERLSSGALPAAVLAGYMSSYNLQTAAMKLKNAAALTSHLAWIVFPALAAIAFRGGWIAGVAVAAAAAFYDYNPLFWASAGIGAAVLLHCARNWRDFLCAWTLIFFAAALVIFFAGSARYLLPVAAPVAILTADALKPRWLYTGAAAGATLAIALAVVNYQHWNAYRSIRHEAPRVFTNAEWGLRHYLESRGARPIVRDQAFWPGDAIVSTAYATSPSYGQRSTLLEREITSPIPLRIVGLGAKSGYSSVAYGLRPFDISTAPLDRVRIEVVSQLRPTLSALEIGTPEAEKQIVSGIYNHDRWTGEKAVVVLKRPAGATSIEAGFFIPPQSPARRIALYADGQLLKEQTYPGPGVHTISAPAPKADAPSIMLAVDKTFVVPPDRRQLGVLLTGIGFR
jgi:hypothetical protein